MGRWWHRGEEIDIVALNESAKEISFLECKWSSVGKKDAERLISDLKRKAALVQWHNAKRREYYGIIARKIENKMKLRGNGYLAYDLEDLKKQLR